MNERTTEKKLPTEDLELKGRWLDDTATRQIYSVDASIYEVTPLAVIEPLDVADVCSAVRYAARHRLTITPRGAATGITGGCLGHGLILDTSRHMNRILEINIDEGYAVCEPGVVQDDLNKALAPHDCCLGPNTSTGNRATIGGMLGNNAAGSRSLLYGRMVDHVLEVDLVIYDGSIITLKDLDDRAWQQKCEEQTAEGEIYRTLTRIRDEDSECIRAGFPSIPRRASGYNLDECVLKNNNNLSALITGSEGSLGIAVRIKVKICPRPQHTGICAVLFDDMVEGLTHIPHMLSFNPTALELIDDQIIKWGRQSPMIRGRLDWLEGQPGAILVAEFNGKTTDDLTHKLNTYLADMQERKLGYKQILYTDPNDIANIWVVREAGVGLLMSRRAYDRGIAFVEDLSIPPERLAAFIEQFKEGLRQFGKEAGIYGHAGSGCIHSRPFIDLKNKEDVRIMNEIMVWSADLVLEHDGVLSGEHGDGFVRSWLNEKMFGPEVYRVFCDIKKAFDPDNIMNPGKVVATQAFLDYLRNTPETERHTLDTFFDFSRQGGFELSVEMCNGNAQCRKREGIMCPSFQASGNERHTTRARAQMLRSIINGKIDWSEMTGAHLLDVLDLCLECKGCKTECPSQVDMAKMKAEVLYQVQKVHGIKLRNRMFASVGLLNRIGTSAPALMNALFRSSPVKYILAGAGISPHRTLPAFAPRRFSRMVTKKQPQNGEKQVVLFNDTYCEFNEPETGQAAKAVMEHFGYEVIIPRWTCCGRPAISKGLLQQAGNMAKAVRDVLLPYARKGLQIVGLEPSCILTIRDDYRDLIPGSETDVLADQCLTFEEFAAQQIDQPAFKTEDWKVERTDVAVHGHCHHKSLVGMIPVEQVLGRLPGVKASILKTGCCGMAGSFGYEKEHYDFSLQVAESSLLPALRALSADTQVIASGISCRNQIKHCTEFTAMHFAEFLYSRLRPVS